MCLAKIFINVLVSNLGNIYLFKFNNESTGKEMGNVFQISNSVSVVDFQQVNVSQ